jgi:hypothetical protein
MYFKAIVIEGAFGVVAQDIRCKPLSKLLFCVVSFRLGYSGFVFV